MYSRIDKSEWIGLKQRKCLVFTCTLALMFFNAFASNSDSSIQNGRKISLTREQLDGILLKHPVKIADHLVDTNNVIDMFSNRIADRHSQVITLLDLKNITKTVGSVSTESECLENFDKTFNYNIFIDHVRSLSEGTKNSDIINFVVGEINTAQKTIIEIRNKKKDICSALIKGLKTLSSANKISQDMSRIKIHEAVITETKRGYYLLSLRATLISTESIVLIYQDFIDNIVLTSDCIGNVLARWNSGIDEEDYDKFVQIVAASCVFKDVERKNKALTLINDVRRNFKSGVENKEIKIGLLKNDDGWYYIPTIETLAIVGGLSDDYMYKIAKSVTEIAVNDHFNKERITGIKSNASRRLMIGGISIPLSDVLEQIGGL